MQSCLTFHNAHRLLCGSAVHMCGCAVLWPSPGLFLQTEWTFHLLWSDCVSSRSADVWRVPSGFIHSDHDSSQSLHISSLMNLCLCLWSRAWRNWAKGIRWKSHDACQEHVMVYFTSKSEVIIYILLKENVFRNI